MTQATKTFHFDPQTQPELYDGVRTKRLLAFCIDIIIIFILTFIGYAVVTILGIITLGLGWLLFAIVFPLIALSYTALTLGGAKSATLGMQIMGIEMRFWHGERVFMLFALIHVLAFWFISGIIGPFIALTSLFNARKRCVHDLLLGTVIIRTLN